MREKLNMLRGGDFSMCDFVKSKCYRIIYPLRSIARRLRNKNPTKRNYKS